MDPDNNPRGEKVDGEGAPDQASSDRDHPEGPPPNTAGQRDDVEIVEPPEVRDPGGYTSTPPPPLQKSKGGGNRIPPPPSPSPGGRAGDPPFGDPSLRLPRPGLLKIIALLYLGAGVYSIIHALGMAGAFCCWLFWIPHLIVGLMGTVHGTKMLSEPNMPPSRMLAILYIAAALDGDLITMIVGIILLVLIDQRDVRAYFDSKGLAY